MKTFIGFLVGILSIFHHQTAQVVIMTATSSTDVATTSISIEATTSVAIATSTKFLTPTVVKSTPTAKTTANQSQIAPQSNAGLAKTPIATLLLWSTPSEVITSSGESFDVGAYKIQGGVSDATVQNLSLDFNTPLWLYANTVTVKGDTGSVIGQVSNLNSSDFIELAASDYRLNIPISAYAVKAAQARYLTVNVTFLPASNQQSGTINIIQAQISSTAVGVSDTEVSTGGPRSFSYQQLPPATAAQIVDLTSLCTASGTDCTATLNGYNTNAIFRNNMDTLIQEWKAKQQLATTATPAQVTQVAKFCADIKGNIIINTQNPQAIQQTIQSCNDGSMITSYIANINTRNTIDNLLQQLVQVQLTNCQTILDAEKPLLLGMNATDMIYAEQSVRAQFCGGPQPDQTAYQLQKMQQTNAQTQQQLHDQIQQLTSQMQEIKSQQQTQPQQQKCTTQPYWDAGVLRFSTSCSTVNY